MTTIHIMLDLETWGTESGSDIRSIGACVFDPLTGSFDRAGGISADHHFYIACDNPEYPNAPWSLEPQMMEYHTHWDISANTWRKYPLIRDPRTVQWWSEQSAEAQAAFANPVDMRDALEAFSTWLGDTVERDAAFEPTQVRLWSHGPSFDPPILAAVYKAVGLPVPWNYRAPRDTRTAFDMAGISDDGDGSYRTFMSAYNTGTYHHALDDAIAQARAVCGAYERAGLSSMSVRSDGDNLRRRAIEAVEKYDDWTNWNETAFTGWGDMIVPDGARIMRENSGAALKLLKSDNR